MAYTIRRPDDVLATFPTFGDALDWANEHPELRGGVGVFWGEEESSMSLAEWRAWANRTVSRLESHGSSVEPLRQRGVTQRRNRSRGVSDVLPRLRGVRAYGRA